MSPNPKRDSLRPPFAKLRTDKERQVVRLVNPTDFKVEFIIEYEPSSIPGRLRIQPVDGVIGPRNFAHIILENPDYKSEPVDLGRLNLFYKRQDHSKRSGGWVPILIKDAREERVVKGSGNTLVWLCVKIFRSLVLVLLIAYNIVLIKLTQIH